MYTHIVTLSQGFPTRARVVAEQIETELVGASAKSRLGTKADLQVKFGVSMATLSQALRLLESKGLVEVRVGPGGGVFATRPPERLMVANLVVSFRHGTATVEQCLAVREILEPHVAAAAARHRSESDISDLRKLIDEMHERLHSPESYLRLNWKLHRRIAEIAPNQVLSMLYGGLLGYLEEECETAVPAAMYLEKRIENLDVHARLVEAIATGDAEAAADLAAHHAPIKTVSLPSDDAERPHAASIAPHAHTSGISPEWGLAAGDGAGRRDIGGAQVRREP